MTAPEKAALSRELADFLIELSIALHKHAMYPEGHRRLGVIHEPQRVDLRRVATRVRGNRADRIGAACRDIRDGEVVALIEAVGEREPGAGRIDVIVFPLLEDLPLERTLALAV